MLLSLVVLMSFKLIFSYDPSSYCALETTSCDGIPHIGCTASKTNFTDLDDNKVEILHENHRLSILTKLNDIRNDYATGRIRKYIRVANMRLLKWNDELEYLSTLLITQNTYFSKIYCLDTHNFSYVKKFRTIIKHPAYMVTFIDESIDALLNESLKHIDRGKRYEEAGVILWNLMEIGCTSGLAKKPEFELVFLCLASAIEDEAEYLFGPPCSKCNHETGECNVVPYDGLCGLSGNRGLNGEHGEHGVRGHIGFSEMGDRGELGDKGNAAPFNFGHFGAIGLKGEKGIIGERGLILIGKKGESGFAGKTGSKGEAGPEGEQGDIGMDGKINYLLEPRIDDWYFYLITGTLVCGVITNFIFLLIKIIPIINQEKSYVIQNESFVTNCFSFLSCNNKKIKKEFDTSKPLETVHNDVEFVETPVSDKLFVL